MRKMPASRKRPCQFLLNVEWCGTGASSGKRQSQVEADFLAQPAFRRDAVEAADQRNADQQFGRDRGTPPAAVVRSQGVTQPAQAHRPVYPAKALIGGEPRSQRPPTPPPPAPP